MRIRTIATLTTLSCGLALAGDGPRAVTYVAGNVSGLTPSNGATLLVENKVLSISSGGNAVDIPYASISKAQVRAAGSKPAGDPLYKVWTLHKRLSGTNEMQQVMVDFNAASGEPRSMTLEMQRATASDVMDAIEEASAHKSAPASGWWGDKYWKTARNPELVKP